MNLPWDIFLSCPFHFLRTSSQDPLAHKNFIGPDKMCAEWGALPKEIRKGQGTQVDGTGKRACDYIYRPCGMGKRWLMSKIIWIIFNGRCLLNSIGAIITYTLDTNWHENLYRIPITPPHPFQMSEMSCSWRNIHVLRPWYNAVYTFDAMYCILVVTTVIMTQWCIHRHTREEI